MMSLKNKTDIIRCLILFTLLGLIFFFMTPFFITVIISSTISLALWPIIKKIDSLGLHRVFSAFLLTFLFALIVATPFLFFVIKGAIVVLQNLQKLSVEGQVNENHVTSLMYLLKNELMEKIFIFTKNLGIRSFVTEVRIDFYLQKFNKSLISFVERLVTNFPSLVVSFFVFFVSTFSFLYYAERIRFFWQNLLGLEDLKMEYLVSKLIQNSRMIYLSNLVTGLTQALIISLSASFFNLGEFFLVFFVTLILSFFPVIGAAPVAFFLAALSFFQGEKNVALVMAIVGTFAGLIDNVMRPYIAGLGGSKLPTPIAFIFVIGGVYLLGFSGLFIGLILGFFSFEIIPILWQELGQKDELEKKSLQTKISTDLEEITRH